MSNHDTVRPPDERTKDERDQHEPTPAKVRSDGAPTNADDGHETGGGHDGMGKGPTGS